MIKASVARDSRNYAVTFKWSKNEYIRMSRHGFDRPIRKRRFRTIANTKNPRG